MEKARIHSGIKKAKIAKPAAVVPQASGLVPQVHPTQIPGATRDRVNQRRYAWAQIGGAGFSNDRIFAEEATHAKRTQSNAPPPALNRRRVRGATVV